MKQELERRVRWAFEHPSQFQAATDRHIELFVNDQPLLGSTTIEYESLRTPVDSLKFEIHLHNSSEKTIEVTAFQVTPLTDDKIFNCRAWTSQNEEPFGVKTSKRANGKSIHVIDNVFQVLPDSWEKLFVHCRTPDNGGYSETDTPEFVLRLFSEIGPQDFPFKLRFKNPASPPKS